MTARVLTDLLNIKLIFIVCDSTVCRIDRQPRVRILSKVIEIITCTLLVEVTKYERSNRDKAAATEWLFI